MNDSQTTIIIIEDEPDTAEMFAEMMRLEGYKVLKSYKSGTAKKLIEENLPNVVVTDIMMPDFSGLDILTWMRSEKHLKDIPAVVVSAKGLPGDIEAGLNAGATIYLTKPVAYQDLRNAIFDVLKETKP